MTAVLVAVMGLCGAVAGALGTYLVARRSTSGRVDTSQAEQLWAAMTRMNDMTQARLERAEDQRDKIIEQRDKLIDGYTNGITPALREINEALRLITEAVEKNAVAE